MNAPAPASPTKEQKQKRILAGLVVVVLGYGLLMFAYKPLKARLDAAEKTIGELEGKVRDSKVALGNAPRNHKRLKEITAEMEALGNENMPLPGNEYAWSARQVFNAAGKLGQRDLQVKEIGLGTSDMRFAAKVVRGPYFQAYTASVTQRTGFFDLVDLIRQIEQANPYVTVSRLTMKPGTDPERHEVTLHLQWPVLAKPEEFKKQQELAQ